ncbi:hypothetical protein JCM6882_007429 [Rhodosporidiobolus microsporus]
MTFSSPSPSLPPELVREAIRLSLLPSSPSLLSASSPSSGASTPSSLLSSGSPSPSPSGPCTPSASDAPNPFDASFAAPTRPPLSRAAQLRSLSLTSHLFRALSQPLLFRSPVLPTLSSALTFLAAVEDDAELAEGVRGVTIGREVGEGGRGGALDAKMVLLRLAAACKRVREVELRGCGRVRVEDLLGFEDLRTLTISTCLLAPSLSFDPSTSPGLLNLTRLTLSSCHLTSHSLPASLFPSLTALALTTPRDSIASSPGQLASFLSAVAPQLRSFSLFDQTASPFAPAQQAMEFSPLLDALPSFSANLTHFESVNRHPLLYVPLLPRPARRSLRTLSFALGGSLDAASPAFEERWQPLVDSLLGDTLALLLAVLAPSTRGWDAPPLPAWVDDLDGVEKVFLPKRAWEEEGLRAAVEGLEQALEAEGSKVAVLPLLAEGEEVGVDEAEKEQQQEKEGRPRSGFWREVDRREEREREDSRRSAEAWW